MGVNIFHLYPGNTCCTAANSHLFPPPRYLSNKFHLFDAAVIVLSFLIDIGLRGPAESIGSLLVVLRLWRLAKISEEVVLGAAERMEMLEHHIDDLEAENKHLRAVVAKSQDQSRDARNRHSSLH